MSQFDPCRHFAAQLPPVRRHRLCARGEPHRGSRADLCRLLARDADGDTITEIALWDTGTGGGHFVVDGVAQAPNVEIDVTAAAQLACR
jgi:hypothetical protein